MYLFNTRHEECEQLKRGLTNTKRDSLSIDFKTNSESAPHEVSHLN